MEYRHNSYKPIGGFVVDIFVLDGPFNNIVQLGKPLMILVDRHPTWCFEVVYSRVLMNMDFVILSIIVVVGRKYLS